ncbi:hypothetical protein [Phycicoccus endophyticus]|nr:hypothetical protein [Phycicoccus endophyticus]
MSAEHVVDARGTRCPVPVVLAARAAAPLSPARSSSSSPTTRWP